MKKWFENVSKIARVNRIKSEISQGELSKLLGYKNGQFVSNVERSFCSVPMKLIKRYFELLKTDREKVKEAILKDYEERFNHFWPVENNENNSSN